MNLPLPVAHLPQWHPEQAVAKAGRMPAIESQTDFAEYLPAATYRAHAPEDLTEQAKE
jgi:hypothetical protein